VEGRNEVGGMVVEGRYRGIGRPVVWVGGDGC
jgi:hypothetical protein